MVRSSCELVENYRKAGRTGRDSSFARIRLSFLTQISQMNTDFKLFIAKSMQSASYFFFFVKLMAREAVLLKKLLPFRNLTCISRNLHSKLHFFLAARKDKRQ